MGQEMIGFGDGSGISWIKALKDKKATKKDKQTVQNKIQIRQRQLGSYMSAPAWL